MKLTKTYIMALLALLLYACSNSEDTLVEPIIDEQEPVVPVSPISFDQSFVEKVTRATINLSEYQTTMGVWGYGNPDSKNDTIFKNQLVEFTEEGWKYSPLKYWDAQSKYDFYAYSPYDAQKVGINTATSRAYLIYINNIETKGVNLQETPSAAEKMMFSGTEDTDWVVSRAAQKNILGASHNTVQFNMQHILSKLNIRMRISAGMATILGPDAYVTLDSLTVGKMASKANFLQKVHATPVTDAEKAASIDEWTYQTGDLTLGRKSVCQLSTDNQYVLESLVLPQAVDTENKVYLEYSIHYADHTEKFKYIKSLNTVSDDFLRLYTGYNYTVTFTLNPGAITFTANAAHWADGQQGDAQVKE